MKARFPIYFFSYSIILYATNVVCEKFVLGGIWFLVLNTLGLLATQWLLDHWKWSGLERKLHPALAVVLLAGGPLLISWLSFEAGVSWRAGGMHIIWTVLTLLLVLLLLVLNPLKVKKDPLDEVLRGEIQHSDWEHINK
ncbi:MAG: hypothetical protein H7X86_06350 [Gorillibacterium sp.]|nr:hypothetical protein [Gorillibacterium sp.]